jgi:hypothetical protein
VAWQTRPEERSEERRDVRARCQAAPEVPAAALLALQRTAGNAAVQRMLAASTGKGAPAPSDEEEMEPITGNGDAGTGTTSPTTGPTTPGPSAPTAPKLKKKNVHGPTPGNSGSFSWVIQWELDSKTTKGGWVVQKVELDHDVKTCDDKPTDPGKQGGLNPAWYPVWEAWPIHKDQTVTTYAEGGDVDDDTYGQKPMKDTKGSVGVRGTPEFYDGLTLPSSFKVTNKAPTWILPATNSAPTLTGGTGAISHDLTATWDGCGSDKKTKLSTK